MADKTCAILLKGLYEGKVEGDFVICADAGIELAKKLNLVPNVIIGDMDSTKENCFPDVELIKYLPEKDYTDGELCLMYAAEKGFDKINIYGAEGGSLDHIVCNIDLLKRAKDSSLKATIYLHNGTLELIDGLFQKKGVKGKTISLVPYGCDAHILYTDGLKYKVSEPTVLAAGKIGLGLSDLALEDEITISIESGEVLYFELNKI